MNGSIEAWNFREKKKIYFLYVSNGSSWIICIFPQNFEMINKRIQLTNVNRECGSNPRLFTESIIEAEKKPNHNVNDTEDKKNFKNSLATAQWPKELAKENCENIKIYLHNTFIRHKEFVGLFNVPNLSSTNILSDWINMNNIKTMQMSQYD